jgi:hypothetical protein
VPGFAGVRVEGLAELQRSFALISDGLKMDLTSQLAAAAGPAQMSSERHAISDITNMTLPWSSMKLGVTPNVVYIAPAMHRRGGSPRPNLAGLLMKRAMIPGVEEALPAVRERLDAWLSELGGEAGF